MLRKRGELRHDSGMAHLWRNRPEVHLFGAELIEQAHFYQIGRRRQGILGRGSAWSSWVGKERRDIVRVVRVSRVEQLRPSRQREIPVLPKLQDRIPFSDALLNIKIFVHFVGVPQKRARVRKSGRVAPYSGRGGGVRGSLLCFCAASISF